MEEKKLNKVEKMPEAHDMPPSKGVVAPEEDWKDNTYYLVCASFSEFNPCHEYVFYSGFINDDIPSGYNQFFYDSDRERLSISDVYYMHVVKELHKEGSVKLDQKI